MSEQLRTRDTAALVAELRHIADRIALAELLKKDRDALVVELHEHGFSEREIARVARMTGPRVHQILNPKETTR